MGLFDSLPAPSKGSADNSLGKRAAEADDGTLNADNSSKKPRTADAANKEAQPLPPTLPCTRIAAAFSEDKGSRLTMEDVAVINFETGAGCRLSFFGIFDGHGGSNVARYAADHLHAGVMAAGLQQEAERLAAAVSAQQQDGRQQQALQPGTKQCKAAIADGFRELDRKVLEQCAAAGWQDGCTAVTVWVVGDTVLVANVGDARCVLARRPQAAAGQTAAGAATAPQRQQHAEQQQEGQGAGDSSGPQLSQQVQSPGSAEQAAASADKQGQPLPSGAAATPGEEEEEEEQQQQQQQQQQQGAGSQDPLKAITLTREHKAIFPQERQRIEKAGSFVSSDGRLAGRIEVSRAFGDRLFKKQGMSALPDVKAFQITPRDAFLLLACDGFWGVFSPQDAVDFAQHEMAEKGHDVKQACNRLIYEAIRERHCKDNCTVMLIQLQH